MVLKYIYVRAIWSELYSVIWYMIYHEGINCEIQSSRMAKYLAALIYFYNTDIDIETNVILFDELHLITPLSKSEQYPYKYAIDTD